MADDEMQLNIISEPTRRVRVQKRRWDDEDEGHSAESSTRPTKPVPQTSNKPPSKKTRVEKSDPEQSAPVLDHSASTPNESSTIVQKHSGNGKGYVPKGVPKRPVVLPNIKNDGKAELPKFRDVLFKEGVTFGDFGVLSDRLVKCIEG